MLWADFYDFSPSQGENRFKFGYPAALQWWELPEHDDNENVNLAIAIFRN